MNSKVFYSASFSSEERGKLPLLRRPWGGEKSFYRGQCGASYSTQQILPKLEQSSLETPRHGTGP